MVEINELKNKCTLIAVQETLSDKSLLSYADEDMVLDRIKENLAHRLAKEIIEFNLVEFTRQYVVNENTHTFRARALMAPVEEIKKTRLEHTVKATVPNTF